MSPSADARITSVPPRGRGLVRLLSTSNPFYVLSAGLFLAGLWASFGGSSEEGTTWALMAGLAGYTALLAVTAWGLVRFAGVWDDVRTVLLLVVLMFLATSVTFDEVLVFDPARGLTCYLAGLLFAAVVSELLLRGIGLALPPGFRLPYHLILALFFLYPLALRPLVSDPPGEAVLWGLFGFAPAAGLAFLTLIPAARRGANYVADNGSPWRWPLYPWVLFGLLGAAVPARALLLCWSMHLLAGDRDHLLFGPFVAAPFGLAVAVLLLEAGLAARRRAVQALALALPPLLVVLVVLGHRDDPVYRQFLAVFAGRVGEPLTVLLLASAAFFGYAAYRRVPSAVEALTLTLAALAVVGPDTLDAGRFTAPQALPLVAAAALQLGLGVRRRRSWRCLVGAAFLALAVAASGGNANDDFLPAVLAFHVAVAAVLLIGALFDDPVATWARLLASAALAAVCLGVLAEPPDRLVPAAGAGGSSLLWAVYPLAVVALLVGYGWALRRTAPLAASGVVLVGWLAVAVWRGYVWLRQVVAGLDQILWSLALFAVAVLVSLAKSGALSRRRAARRPAAAGPWPEGDRVQPGS